MDQAHPLPSPTEKPSPEDCRAMPELLGHIGDRWTIMVIGNLSFGPLRYKQLQREVQGISQRMLTLTLKSLEQDGLVSRTVFATVPPRVDYELTPLGRSLMQAIKPLHEWVIKHRPEVLAARETYARRLED